MNFLRWPLVMLAVVALHWGFSLWTLLGATPHAALVATVAAAVIRGPVAGQTFGFLSGLLVDSISTHLFGANALILTLTGYGAGRLRRQMDASLPPPQMAVAVLVSWLHFALTGLLGLVFLGRFQGRPAQGLLLVPFYNALLAPFAFALLQRLRVKEGRGAP